MEPSASIEREKAQSKAAIRFREATGAPGERDQMISVKEAAALLRLSEISIRRYLTQKKLRRFKVGPGRGRRTLLSLNQVLGLIREA